MNNKEVPVLLLTGYLGSGKTTLIDLLPRFYDVSEGEILINGINIKEYSLKNLNVQSETPVFGWRSFYQPDFCLFFSSCVV